MAFSIRRPVEITRDPAPREREDRKQRSRLTEEMRRFQERTQRRAEQRSQRAREQAGEATLNERLKASLAPTPEAPAPARRSAFGLGRPTVGQPPQAAPTPTAAPAPVRTPQPVAPEPSPEQQIAEGFAPRRAFNLGQADTEAGAQNARAFASAIEQSASPGYTAKVLEHMSKVLKEERVSAEDLAALVSGEQRLINEDLEATSSLLQKLSILPAPSKGEMQQILDSDLPEEEKMAAFEVFRQATLARQETAPALGAIELPFHFAGRAAEEVAEAAGAGPKVQIGANIAAQLGLGLLGARVVPTALLSRLPSGARTAVQVASVASTAEARRAPRVPTGAAGAVARETAQGAPPVPARAAGEAAAPTRPSQLLEVPEDLNVVRFEPEVPGATEQVARATIRADGIEVQVAAPAFDRPGAPQILRLDIERVAGRAGLGDVREAMEVAGRLAAANPERELRLTVTNKKLADLMVRRFGATVRLETPEFSVLNLPREALPGAGPTRAAGEAAEAAPIPAQAVDDFEVVPSEAMAASARDLPPVAGGAEGGFTTSLRPFDEIVGEVVTRDDPIAQALARSGVNPSLLESSDVGRATVAFSRQRGASEQIINVTLASAVDSHRTGVGRALPIAIGDDGFATLGSGRRLPWNDLFSTNKFDSELTSAQRAFIEDYRRVVDEVEFQRTVAGLKPRAVRGAGANEGWFYIPRQVRGIRGMELRRPSSPGLQRHYDEAVEGIKNGIDYESDPRAVLELHLRQSYREIAEKQMSDFLEPLSITPKELVPEKIRARMNAAVTDRMAAERARRALTVSRAVEEVDPEAAMRLRGRMVRRPAGEKGFELQGGKLTPQRRAADVRLAAARKEYAAAKNIYGRALESARKAELAPGNLFGKAEDVIPIAQWRNRFFPLEDAQRLNESLGAFLQTPRRANWVGRGFEQLGNHIRFLSAIGDFAAPFIQGLPLLGRNPLAWSRATLRHYQAWWTPTVQAKYIRDHIETFQEMARHNVPVGDVEFFKAIQEGQGISAGALIERLPKGEQARNLFRLAGKQTFGRFQASYDMFLTSARAQLWESMKPGWKGSLDELATHIRNMTGGLDSKALGVGPTQRGFESTWLAFSPRLLRSTFALVGDLRLGLKNPRGRAAYQALGGLAAGTVGLYIASGLAMGKSEQEIRTGLNPLEGKKFLSYNINGDWVGAGGQIRAILQLLARSAADPKSLLELGQFDNPLLQFASSRGAVGLRIAQTIVEGTTGADVLPYDEIDGLPDIFLHIGQSALPFAVQGRLEGEGARTFGYGIAGARTSPGTAFERLENARRAAMDERGISGSFDDLRRNQPDVALEIDRDPRVVEPQRALDDRPPRTQEGEGFQQLEETRTEFRGRQQQDDDNLRDFFRSGGQTEFTPGIYSDNARDRARELANRRDQIRRDFELEFAERVPDPGTVGAAIENYFGVDIEDFTDSLTGQVDWGPFNDAQDRALSGLSEEQREGAMSVIRKNQTDIQRAFRELRDEPEVNEYWDISPEDRDGRERFRTLHPRVDAILYITGTTSKLMNGRSLAEANALARRLFGSGASIPTSEIRERAGGGGLVPRRSDLIPSGAGGLMPRRSDLLP